MESTDSTMAMNSLTLNLDRMTELRKSQASLLSATSDDPSLQINDVSNRCKQHPMTSIIYSNKIKKFI